jgi:CheY-like chemotaxis protein
VQALSGLGFEVSEACNGVEALAQAQALQPDLLLLDLVMPDMGGIEVIRRLRRLPLFATTPIVAVSASATPDAEADTLAAGANAFLPKPVDLKNLMQLTAQLLKLAWVDVQDQRARA